MTVLSQLTSASGMGSGSRSRGCCFVRIWLVNTCVEDISERKCDVEGPSLQHVLVTRVPRVPNLAVTLVGRARVLGIFPCNEIQLV